MAAYDACGPNGHCATVTGSITPMRFVAVVMLLLVVHGTSISKFRNVKMEVLPVIKEENLPVLEQRHVYHIGGSEPYGRTNNQLCTILRALDKMLDEQYLDGDTGTTTIGSGILNNSTAILAISGWASDLLEDIVLAPSPSPSSSNNNRESKHNNNDTSWVVQQIEPFLPIRHWNSLPSKNVNASFNAETVNVHELDSKSIYYYLYHKGWQNTNETVFTAKLERRRRWVLRQLFQRISKKHLEPYKLLQAYMKNLTTSTTPTGTGTTDEKRFSSNTAAHDLLIGDGSASAGNDRPIEYMAVHIRSLEGQCQLKLGNALSQDECNMNPDYIKGILRSYGGVVAQNTYIVVISDMQNQTILERLQADSELGPQVLVPALLPQFQTLQNSVYSDMVIAALSDIFVGTRISSMAINIGQARVALGAPPQSNYIFVQEQKPKHSATAKEGNHSTNASLSPWTTRMLEVCSNCLFYCNRTRLTVCGKKSPSSLG